MDPTWFAVPVGGVAVVAIPLVVQRARWRIQDRRLAADRRARFAAFREWVSAASLEELDAWKAQRRAEEDVKREAIWKGWA